MYVMCRYLIVWNRTHGGQTKSEIRGPCHHGTISGHDTKEDITRQDMGRA